MIVGRTAPPTAAAGVTTAAGVATSEEGAVSAGAVPGSTVCDLQTGRRRATRAADTDLHAVGAVGQQRLGAADRRPGLGGPLVGAAPVGRGQGLPAGPAALLAQADLDSGPCRRGTGPGDADRAEVRPAQLTGQRCDLRAGGGAPRSPCGDLRSGERRGPGGPGDAGERGRGHARRHGPRGHLVGDGVVQQRRDRDGDRGEGRGGKAEQGKSAHSGVFQVRRRETGGHIGCEARSTYSHQSHPSQQMASIPTL